MTDAQDAAKADERVARALDDENAPHAVPATRAGTIVWRCHLAGWWKITPGLMASVSATDSHD